MQAAQRKIAYETQTAPQPRKRVVKIEGNVAYISSDFAGSAVKKPATAAKTAAKPKAAPKKAEQPKKGLLSTLFVVFVAFCALAVLVSRYAAASSVGRQNNDLEQSIAAIENQIDALKVDLELKDNLVYVQLTAQQDLNMNYPDPDQIIETEP